MTSPPPCPLLLALPLSLCSALVASPSPQCSTASSSNHRPSSIAPVPCTLHLVEPSPLVQTTDRPAEWHMYMYMCSLCSILQHSVPPRGMAPRDHGRCDSRGAPPTGLCPPTGSVSYRRSILLPALWVIGLWATRQQAALLYPVPCTLQLDCGLRGNRHPPSAPFYALLRPSTPFLPALPCVGAPLTSLLAPPRPLPPPSPTECAVREVEGGACGGGHRGEA